MLVHGSVSSGVATWSEQRPLAERFTLVVPSRGGYPPNPRLERIDFEEQAFELAEILATGDHVVGHSYGGVVSLLAAAHRADVIGSLAVIEPPAFGVALGHPAVDQFVERMSAFFAAGPYEPRAYLEGFLAQVGAVVPLPDPLPPMLEAGARAASVERPPWEAEIPVGELARAPFRKLVVSGGHSAAMDAVCDVLERELRAERAVIRGAGHSVQRTGAPFNARLEAFVSG